MESYHCIKCNKYVLTRGEVFIHPHLGMKTCLVCCKCGGMVYLREQGSEKVRH